MKSLEDVLDSLPFFDNEETSFKYSKGARRKGLGLRYEELAIALVFLRCLRKRLPDFELTSDNSYTAGRFDDIVVTWNGYREKYTLLVQLKHKTSKEFEEIRRGHLFSSSDNNKSDFKISKYDESFRSIKKNLSCGRYALAISTNVPLHDNARCYFRERQKSSVLGADLLDTGGRVFVLDNTPNRCDRDFMEHFFMFCNQKGVNELRDEVCVELVRLLGPSDSCESLCEELCRCVMEWKDAPSDDRGSLNGSWTQWQGIVRLHRASKVNDCDALTTRLKFRNVDVIRQHVESVNPACVRPMSADTMVISTTKVHQAIYPETHILVNVKRFRESKQSVLRWWGPSCRWLVLVDDDAEETGQSSYMLNVMRGLLGDGCRLIVVSLKVKASFRDSFSFGDITEESWDNLLLTKIRLNGDKRKCRLGDLVSSTAELKTLLKNRLSWLVALARKLGYVKLGQPLAPLPGNYVPRQLVTRRYVKDEFFSSLAVRDVCITDNSTYRLLLDKLDYIRKNYKVCTFEKLEGYLAMHMSKPILAIVKWIDIVTLEGISRKYKGIQLYLVKHSELGWDVQQFLTSNLRIRRYVKEQTIQLLDALDVFNNKIIVEGRPGVGKSTLLLHLAREVEQNNPSSWIVRINLRECFGELHKSMSSHEIRKFLLERLVSNEGDLAGLEFNLLHHCLEKYKHMVCLVDSFDEVCPDNAEELLRALRLLSPRQGKLVVTTRTVAARLLEEHLGSLAHLLPAFSDHQLQKYFEKCRPKASSLRVDTLKTRLKDLLRIPLFAEMYCDLMEVGRGSYDTLALFEAFFHYRLGGLYVEKFGDNFSDAGKREEVKNLWKSHETKLKRLATLLLVQNCETIRQLKQSPVDDSFVKAGIVHQVTGGKLIFAHRTFGEYFLAKWCFSDASRKTRARVYRSAYSGRSLEFFLEVFDRMSGQRRPLLSAVLDGDERRVGALLEAGVGLAERDVWGRSALHLAAAQGAGSALLHLLCAHMGPALAEEDGLVHWTPLQYAANRGHWGAVEALLQAGADLRQLGNVHVGAENAVRHSQ